MGLREQNEDSLSLQDLGVQGHLGVQMLGQLHKQCEAQAGSHVILM